MNFFFRSGIGVWAFGLATGLSIVGPASLSADDEPVRYTTGFGALPQHPTMIVTTYDGKTYPIIGTSGEFPKISLGGSTKTLRSSGQLFQAIRATAYASGSVQISNQVATSVVTARQFRAAQNGLSVPIGVASYDGKYSCTIQSPEAHPDCYVTVLYYQLGADGSPDPATVALGFGHAGDLKAGQPKEVMISDSYVLKLGGQRGYYFPMAFSQGRELRSNFSEAADQYFHLQEYADHLALVEQYTIKYKGTDHPAVPYLRIPLQLPPGVDPHSLPPNLKATFSVDEAGTVDSVQLSDGLTPAVTRLLAEEIRSWMFLPRLKQGYPVRTLINLPLEFN